MYKQVGPNSASEQLITSQATLICIPNFSGIIDIEYKNDHEHSVFTSKPISIFLGTTNLNQT